MELSRPPLVVAFELSEKRKAIVADALAGASAVVYLTELDEAARAEALRNTGALLTFNTSKELRSGEAALLDGARLIQFMIAGVDFIPLGELPEGVSVATNGGGYAESMAEHALAMALAAAKRLILEHENLKLGQFNQFTWNRMLAGGLCGIFGFGGIGAATARLMHSIGMRVHAINRHGRTDERVDWIGTPERRNELLEAADVLLISAPLTRATYGLIGAAETSLPHRTTRHRALARTISACAARDGMNLVAKEYVAAQDPTDPAVLILSKFAGAAQQLTGALIVNPNDKLELAEAIRDGLQMSHEERVTRWQGMIGPLQDHDVSWWAAAFLRELAGQKARAPAKGT